MNSKKNTKKEHHTGFDEVKDYSVHITNSIKNEPLTVIICNEESEIVYKKLRSLDNNILICSDIKYLNSVNHLDSVQEIILDYQSFTDMKEILFLIKVFKLLHQGVSVIISYDNDSFDLSKFKKMLVEQSDIYVIDKELISKSYFNNMIPIQSAKEQIVKKRKNFNISKKLKKAILIVLVIIITAAIIVTAYLFIMKSKQSMDVNNRNMNIQLDMETSTILPIEKVYNDSTGNHIIIEEITENMEDSLKIGLYDQNQEKVPADLQKKDCPDGKCTYHYELVFSHSDSVEYYIVQLEKNTTTKNVEIDNLYFE